MPELTWYNNVCLLI